MSNWQPGQLWRAPARATYLAMQTPCEKSRAFVARACVLFESAASLQAAKTLCSQYQCDGIFGPIQIDGYAFESLKTPETHDASLRDAINADLLIIAVDKADLPRSVRFWVGKFIGSKSNRVCALAALTTLHFPPWNSLATVREYLRAIAELEGMPFASYRFEVSEGNICLLADDEDERADGWSAISASLRAAAAA